MINNEKTITKLSTVEWKIYNYLKERTQKGLWTSQQNLVEYLENIESIKMNKRTLRKHIQNIRRCEIVQKVILTNYSKGYKIMNGEEQYEILLKRKVSILKSLKQFHKDRKRLELNGQMKLTFDTKEREFIESLLK